MWILSLVLLILLGLLGISSWLKQRRPSASEPLNQLAAFEGWIGLAGLIWGLFLLLRWIAAINVMQYPIGAMLVALVNDLVIVALSLILSVSLLRALIGENAFTAKLVQLANQLQPYKIGLGAACLALALYALLTQVFYGRVL